MYYNGDDTVQAEYLYVYSADGQLAKQYAVSGGNVVEEYSFEYDSLGRLIRSREDKGSSNVQRTEHLYDTANRLTKQSWSIGGKAFTESYTYRESDGGLNTFTAPTGDTLTYQYDALKRPSTTTVKNTGNTTLFTTARNYKTSGNKSSNQISGFSYRNASGGIINYNTYEYDTAGNIKKVYQVTSSGTQLIAEYSYDSQNQLVEETYGGTTYQYTYDTAGNILSKSTAGIVLDSYTYGNANWRDLLTAYENRPIYYEGQKTASGSYSSSIKPLSGNPINWYNGSSYSNLKWTQGRQLTSLEKGGATISYTYDMEGIRTGKVANGATRSYITQNGRVVQESVSSSSTSYTIDIIYDSAGKPFSMIYTNSQGGKTTFYYVLNMQGDVQRHKDTKTGDGSVS